MTTADESKHLPQNDKPNPIVLLITLFVFVDFFGGAAIDYEPPAISGAVLQGLIVAQLGLLAIWAVLGPQPLVVRWPLALLTTAVLYCVAIGGVLIGGYDTSLAEVTAAILVLPIVCLSVQLPVWILRLATGGCIARRESTGGLSAKQSRQFDLKQMLGSITVVALALGLARLGVGAIVSDSIAVSVVWIGFALFCVMSSVISAFLTLPCIYAALVARNKVMSTLAMGAYSIFLAMLVRSKRPRGPWLTGVVV